MAQQNLVFFVKKKQVISGPYSVPRLIGMLKKRDLTLQSPLSADKVQWESLQELFKRLDIDISFLQFAPEADVPEEPLAPDSPFRILPTVEPFAADRPVRGLPAEPCGVPVPALALPFWERLCRLIWDPAAEADLAGEEKKAAYCCLLYALSAAVLSSGFRGWPFFWHRLGSIGIGAVYSLLTAWILAPFPPCPLCERTKRLGTDVLSLFLPLVTLLLSFAALWPGGPFPPGYRSYLAAGGAVAVFTFFTIRIGCFFLRRFPAHGTGASWGGAVFVLAVLAVHYVYMIFIKEF